MLAAPEVVEVAALATVSMIFGNSVRFSDALVLSHLSTNVMLSAISATRFAILDAMMAYADVTPPPDALSPAMDAALFRTGVAAFCAYDDGLATPFGAFFAGTYGFLMGARGAEGFLAVPFICGTP